MALSAIMERMIDRGTGRTPQALGVACEIELNSRPDRVQIESQRSSRVPGDLGPPYRYRASMKLMKTYKAMLISARNGRASFCGATLLGVGLLRFEGQSRRDGDL
jgi:hypothetical protein